MDTLYMKHGSRAVDILRAVAEHDLDNDNDVKELKNMIMGEREKITKAKEDKIKAVLKLDPADQEEVEKAFKDAGPIDVSTGFGGAIQVQEFLKIFKLLVMLQIRFNKRHEDKYKKQRKAALKSPDQ